jgi:hypothetical protein
MVAPITAPNNRITKLGSTNVWFPKGDWFDFFKGTHYTSKSGRTLSVHRSINDMPVFAKAGAIVPLQEASELKAGNDLAVFVFPGKSNRFKLYEDAGDGDAFTRGEFVQTEMVLDWKESPVFTVKPAQGATEILPEIRKYCFIFRGFDKNIRIKALIDGNEAEIKTKYDAKTTSVIVNVSAKTASEIQFVITGDILMTDNGDLLTRCTKLLQKMQLATETKERLHAIIADPDMALTRKIREINFRAIHSAEHQGLIDALIEQFKLTE